MVRGGETADGAEALAEGADHEIDRRLDVAVYLVNLATLHQDLGREDEATPLFERALGIWSVPDETI